MCGTVLKNFKVCSFARLSGDGFIDKEEYKNFWFHVGGYPALKASRLDHIYNVLTEVTTPCSWWEAFRYVVCPGDLVGIAFFL